MLCPYKKFVNSLPRERSDSDYRQATGFHILVENHKIERNEIVSARSVFGGGAETLPEIAKHRVPAVKLGGAASEVELSFPGHGMKEQGFIHHEGFPPINRYSQHFPHGPFLNGWQTSV